MKIKTLVTEAENLHEEIEETEESLYELDEEIIHAENFAMVAGALTVILSLSVAIVVFCGIVKKKGEPKSRIVRWWKEFLNFRKIWIAGILKFVYIFLAAAMTIGGVAVMVYGGDEPWVMVLVGLGVVIFGNLFLRIGFEMTMIMIGMWENTSDIRRALVKEKREDK